MIITCIRIWCFTALWEVPFYTGSPLTYPSRFSTLSRLLRPEASLLYHATSQNVPNPPNHHVFWTTKAWSKRCGMNQVD